MRAGKAIRDQKALQHAGDKLCECGHQMRGHCELKPTWELRDGAIEEVPHPDYVPLNFHCSVEGCECVRVEAAR